MKIFIAIDSFKGSLSSIEAAKSAKAGISCVFPDAEITVSPVADGGEGTVDALTEGMCGQLVTAEVTGPLGETVTAKYGIVGNNTAVIEMSQASGITLVPEEKRNPLHTTTRGVGELILDAINKGCRSFIVGIGGSATNDGGTGMLTALGYGFYDKDGNEISCNGEGLCSLAKISAENVNPLLKQCSFKVACDVTNPLCGEMGCSAVFGRQKGGDDETLKKMDSWLREYAILTKQINPCADETIPGSGAAGGLGFAFRSYLDASLEKGIELVLGVTGTEEKIKQSDLVITGEGKLDGQTAMGKAPAGVAAIAKKYGVPVIAFSGCVGKDAAACNDCGIDAFFPILRNVTTLEQAMDNKNAYENLSETARQVARLIKVFYK